MVGQRAIAVGFALIATAIIAYGEPKDIEELGPADWPTTVEGAVQDILSQMSDADKTSVRHTRKEDLIKFHFGWGLGIRNYYGLWQGNTSLIISACGHPCHPDEASMRIIEAVWQEVQK
jgi:uncharacterized protein DUF6794